MSVTIEIGGKESVLLRMQEDPVQTTIDRLGKLVKERCRHRTKGKGQNVKLKKEKKAKGKGKARRRQAELAASEAAAAAATVATESPAESASVPDAEAEVSEAGADLPDESAPIWVADSHGNEVRTLKSYTFLCH